MFATMGESMGETLSLRCLLTHPLPFTRLTGSALTLRVMAKQPDALTGYGEARIHTETALFDVQTADVAQPMVGDRLTLEGVSHIVQSEPTADRDRLIWTLNTRPE